VDRYTVSRFDGDTFVVIDQRERREICVCGNYDNWSDAERRAEEVATLMNGDKTQQQ